MQALHDHIAKDGFRLRGTAMSRVDGFSDVVFGFALTLLVVSLEVPHTFDELRPILLGFIPFAICFFFLILVWWSHFTFFRRYGLHDTATIALNACLLFTILFYVYPLKFTFSLVAFQTSSATAVHAFSHPHQARELMIVYGAGFAAIYFLLSAMYFNAWRQRMHLRLSPLETTLTQTYVWNEFAIACVGLCCIVAACIIPEQYAGTAGLTFALITLVKRLHKYITTPRIRAAHARTSPADRTHAAHR